MKDGETLFMGHKLMLSIIHFIQDEIIWIDGEPEIGCSKREGSNYILYADGGYRKMEQIYISCET
jgi:hypothetical protein